MYGDHTRWWPSNDPNGLWPQGRRSRTIPGMRAKRRLIASVLFVLLGAWIAPAVTTPSLASDAADTAVIVQGTSAAAVRAAVAAHHGKVTQDLWIVNGVGAAIPAAELAGLAAEPGVLHVS